MEAIPQGVVRLIKLQKEGSLKTGDTVATSRLGECTVATIESTHTITVRDAVGKYFRLSGLSFGSDTRMIGGAA